MLSPKNPEIPCLGKVRGQFEDRQIFQEKFRETLPVAKIPKSWGQGLGTSFWGKLLISRFSLKSKNKTAFKDDKT